MSLVTPPDQKSPNFLDGLEILKRYRQEEGTRSESRNDSIAARTPLPKAKGSVGVTVDTSSARYVRGRRDRGHRRRILPYEPYGPRGSVGFPAGEFGRVGPLPSLPVHATFEDAAIAATSLKSHGSKNLYR